jgi:hypothetical protein
MQGIRYFVFISLILYLPTELLAGSQAGGEVYFTADQITTFSKKVDKTLAAKGAHVFIVARQGRAKQELPRGIDYTHVGIAVYSAIMLSDGRVVPGYTYYNLYQSDKDPWKSYLQKDYAADFFSPVYQLKAGITIPDEKLQRRILKLVENNTHQTLHNPKYSVLANPFDTEYQNCTEYVLDMLTAALYDTTDKAKLKANQQAYFKPHPVSVGPLKLLFGSLFVPGVTALDHDGPINTATYKSIEQFLSEYDLVKETFVIEG